MLTRSSMKLFSDDTTLYIEIENQNDTSAILNDDLENIQQWADRWLIKFSLSETKLMTCSFKAQSHWGYDQLPTTDDRKRCRPPKIIGEHWPPKNVAVTSILISD